MIFCNEKQLFIVIFRGYKIMNVSLVIKRRQTSTSTGVSGAPRVPALALNSQSREPSLLILPPNPQPHALNSSSAALVSSLPPPTSIIGYLRASATAAQKISKESLSPST